jgi:glucan phosphoethanolaminetransferase (alkaline phosphatase superfamily)
MMEAESTSKSLENLYQTTWCNNPEDSHLHQQNVFILLNQAGFEKEN